jgi:hypothetical protein
MRHGGDMTRVGAAMAAGGNAQLDDPGGAGAARQLVNQVTSS